MGCKTLLWPIVALHVALAQASTPAPQDGSGTISCASIPPPEVPGADIIEFTATERYNVSGIVVREFPDLKIDTITGLNICNVNVSLTHPGVDDKVDFEVWLPLEGWNGRFQAVGGGGWVAGHHGAHGLGIPVEQGFATGITTGGNLADQVGVLQEDILTGDGELDRGRVVDFAHRALHELSVVGKSITASYYGTPAKYSYWSGCSQGGRQGLTLAQKYPGDFDGILAAAPAVSFVSLLFSLAWPEFTTRWKKHTPSVCAFKAFQSAAVDACDELDGVLDRVIANTDACHFEPSSVVGSEFTCGTDTVTITDKDAEVVAAIHSGPFSHLGTQLNPPYSWGINYTATVNVAPGGNDLWNKFLELMVKKDPTWDYKSLDTLEEFTDLFAIAQAEIGHVFNSEESDLSGFREQGGKLMTWHGTADDMIMLNNTIRYRKRVEDVMGGNERVNEFYRVFVAPGVAHCIGGNGAFPTDAFTSLIDWVENGKAPEELHGTPRDRPATRKICLWPLVARYDGEGDENHAESYHCASSFIGPNKC